MREHNKCYDTAIIRKLLTEVFDDEEFTEFCYDYYHEAYHDFTASQNRGTKIQTLIRYCEGRDALPGLLDRVSQVRPGQFEPYRDKVYLPPCRSRPLEEREVGQKWPRIENLTRREIKERELLYLDRLIAWINGLWEKEAVQEGHPSGEECISDDMSVSDRRAAKNNTRSEDYYIGRRFRKVKGRYGRTKHDLETPDKYDESSAKGPVMSLKEMLKDIVGSRLPLGGYSRQLYALLGEPGCGKTTALRKLACDAARLAIRSRRGISVRRLMNRPIPVYVDLRWYRQSTQEGNPIPFDDFLHEYMVRMCKKYVPEAEFIANNLNYYLDPRKNGALLLLLDSMNEMPRLDHSKRAGEIEKFLSDNRTRCRAIVACRSRHWYDQHPLREMVMLPLDNRQIEEFIARQIPESKAAAQELFGKLKEKWLRLCRNPQRLRVLINLCYDYKTGYVDDPPNSVAELFEAFTQKLIKDEIRRVKRLAKSLPFSSVDVALALDRLGFAMTHDMGKGSLVDWDWALKSLSIPMAEYILDFACNARILCGPTPASDGPGDEENQRGRTELRFTHQLLQEYFASREMERIWSMEDISPQLRESWWEETILLLADTVDDPDTLVRKILRAQSPPNSCTLRLAAECTARRREECSEQVIAKTRNALASLVQHGQPGVMASAVIALGYLDDEQSASLTYDRLLHWVGPIKEVALETLEGMRNEAAEKALREYYTSKAGIFQLRKWWGFTGKIGGSDALLLRAKLILRVLARTLYGLSCPLACLAIYLYSKFRSSSPESAIPTPTPTPKPIPIAATEPCTGILPVLGIGLTALLIVVGLRLAIKSRQHLKELRQDHFKLRVPIENYLENVWGPIFLGVLGGYLALLAWSIREGWPPFSTGQVLSIPLCISSYSLYMVWAWATVQWFLDLRAKGESPSDDLAFSISGIVFTFHLVIATALVVIGAVFWINHPNAPWVLVPAVLFSDSIFDSVQRFSIFCKWIVLAPLLVLPSLAGILSVHANIKFLQEWRQLGSLRREWYNLLPQDKWIRLKDRVLPILSNEHKRDGLRKRALHILSELRIEDVGESDSEGEMLRKTLVQLANLQLRWKYCQDFPIYPIYVQLTYVAVRDRYLKRPERERNPAIVSLLSLILDERYPPYQDAVEVISAAVTLNPDLAYRERLLIDGLKLLIDRLAPRQ